MSWTAGVDWTAPAGVALRRLFSELPPERELQFALDLFRPGFDEEMVGDITTNTRVLWQELWGKDINVRQEIIAPAIALRNKGYLEQMARESYSDDLRKLSES